MVEKADEHSVVTFVHLACSGATIEKGLLGPYEGIEAAQPPLPAQIDEMARLAGKRSIDAVEMSIGVNNLELGAVLGFCMKTAVCDQAVYKDGLTLDQWMKGALAGLPAAYRGLDARIGEVLDPGVIYITRYPDTLRGDDGRLCDQLIGAGQWEIDSSEVSWLDAFMATPLDKHVGDTAFQRGWNVIDGASQAFVQHGYCARDNWIRTMAGSIATQHDHNGTIHPTPEGHRVLGRVIFKRLKQDLLPKGEPRPLDGP
jgi:hypothetical protein